MRAAISQKLIGSIPEIEGRVFEFHAIDVNTTKPYLVLKQGADTKATPWADFFKNIEDARAFSARIGPDVTPWAGFIRNIEIWPYVSGSGAFQTVDGLAEQIITELDGQQLMSGDGELFTCRFLGTLGGDHADTGLDAISRGLKFVVLAVQPVPATDSVENDPWLEALSEWTESMLGTDWAVYRNVWPMDYRTPAVLWRLSNVEISERARSVFEVQKTFTGHVLGAGVNEQQAAIVMIVQQLGGAAKILFDSTDRRYLTVSCPRAECEADAFNTGQLSITLKRQTSRPVENAPLIAAVHNKGNI
jgi:hypothetical protein